MADRKEGDRAPAFSPVDAGGKRVRLSDFAGVHHGGVRAPRRQRRHREEERRARRGHSGHEAAEACGAWGEKNLYGKKSMGVLRTTVIIDERGTVARVIRRVKAAGRAAEALAALY